MSAAEYGSIIIAYRNGAAVRLSDVATLVEGAENTKLGGWMNATPALLINVAAPAGRERGRRRRQYQEAPAHPAGLAPRGVDLQVLTDRTTTIRASIRDVRFELILAVVLVVLVIFLFLRNVRPPSFLPFQCPCP